MKKKNIDIISGICLMLFAVWGWYLTSGWKESSASAGISVKAYPRVVFAGIFICGLAIVIRTLIRMRSDKEDVRKALEVFSELHPVRVAIFVAMMVAYVYALRAFGFVFVTPVYLFVAMLFFGERKWIRMIIISVVGTAVLWLFFVKFMHVHF